MRSTPWNQRVALVLILASLVFPVAHAEVAGEVSRSDIAIGQPNVLPSQAVGLGNGKLGAAFWAADGLTIQLNRIDTLPYRRSPGQLVFPDLKIMTADRAFHGRVRLYDGALEESGGGVALNAWVDRDTDRVVIDLDGLPASTTQRIRLQLWAPRTPHAFTDGDAALLAESWRDDTLPGASGRSFGSLAGVRVLGRQVHAAVIDARTVEVTALPDSSGHLRVIAGAPAFDGSNTAREAIQQALSVPVDRTNTERWWHAYWTQALRIQATSADGVARYAETLRTLYLFAAAAHAGSAMPGAQAGIADLFSSSADDHFWDPAAYWFWNTRMQVGANLAAGLPGLNDSVFALYRNNLAAVKQWTLRHMDGREGACIPETMRFNGNGVEYESDRFRPFAIVTHSCDLSWTPTSNARTLTTGAEVGLWVWRTYLQTGDHEFLHSNYPLMAEAARFLLAYQKRGDDGLLHTSPSNAHETQVDVTDPATDIAAIRALYPATVAAAQALGVDADLSDRLLQALAKTPALPTMSSSTGSDAGAQVLAASADAHAPYQNGENIGLEAVWPYGLIGVDSALFPVAQRTYLSRPFKYAATWSYDPVQAAYLGLGDEAAKAIFELVQRYQVYPNGMAALLHDQPSEFYLEQAAVTALALPAMLAIEDNHHLVRIAPALPSGWTMRATVAITHGGTVEVEAVEGKLVSFAFEGEGDTPREWITPWAHAQVLVWRDGKPQASIDAPAGRFSFHPASGHVYRFALSEHAPVPVFDISADATVKSLGRASIGLTPPCCAPPAHYVWTQDK
ncbi:glycosyl hydrolase family 95 catalytic domain-containing protein [Dyella japonica]|uniref:Glycosyl hydrolase family 95 catalytic domain-containing protein n=1 Tax=Dyella japonica TaxID=231455 RepID=A0ABV2K067_9GAMM